MSRFFLSTVLPAVLVGGDVAIADTGVSARPPMSFWNAIAAVCAWWRAVRRVPTDAEVLDEKS